MDNLSPSAFVLGITERIRIAAHLPILLVRNLRGRLVAPEAETLARLVETNATCIDIGAHCGSWTLPFSRHLTGGRVLAIEALPYYAGLLRSFTVFRRNVVVFNLAAVSLARRVEIVWKDPLGRRLTGFTHMAGKNESPSASVIVRGQRIDDIVEYGRWNAVKFIKVDVEGAELDALKGCLGVIGQGRPLIYAEINRDYCARYGHEPKDVHELLTALSYTAWRLVENKLVAFGHGDYRPDDNILFVPAERVGLLPMALAPQGVRESALTPVLPSRDGSSAR
jgi:FkbM family methyltransferase